MIEVVYGFEDILMAVQIRDAGTYCLDTTDDIEASMKEFSFRHDSCEDGARDRHDRARLHCSISPEML